MTGRNKPRLAVVYDEGAASPTEIAGGIREFADLHFVVPRSPRLRETLPLLQRYGSVSMLDRTLRSGRPAIAVDGIVTFSERMLSDTAELAVVLGLPYNTPTCVEALRSKQVQRRVLSEAGLDHARYEAATGARALRTALASVGTPAVVKPDRGEASRDTHLVRHERDAEALVAHFANRPPTPLVVEQLLDGRDCGPFVGDYVSVETAVVDGFATQLAVTGKFPLSHPFRETGDFWPARLDDTQTGAIATMVSTALQALGVTTGICHTELKLTPHGPRIIEVNGRLGGYIAELGRRATGVDVIGLAGRIALGLDVDLGPLRPERVYFHYRHPAPSWATTLIRVEGQSRVVALDGIDSYRVTRPLPAGLDPMASTNADHLGGHADSFSDAVELLDRASGSLLFTYLDDNGSEFQVAGSGLRGSDVRKDSNGD